MKKNVTKKLKSVTQEIQNGVKSLKDQIKNLEILLLKDPSFYKELEKQIHQQFKSFADHITAALLQSTIDKRKVDYKQLKDNCLKAGNPLKSQQQKNTNITFLGGTIFQINTWKCASDKRKFDQLNLTSVDRSGIDLDLSSYGFGKLCSPALEEQVSRLACLCPSFEVAKKEMDYQGLNLDIKQIKRITKQAGIGVLNNRIKEIEQWKNGELLEGDELKGKKVVVAIDGGRTRCRYDKEKGYEGIWREPKLLIIYIINKKGKREKESKHWIEGTLGDADHIMELLAMKLWKLGASKAKIVEFISDGAPWIWNRIDFVAKKIKLKSSKLIKVLDFWHAAHHISSALEKVQCKSFKFKKLRKLLLEGKWEEVVKELKEEYSDGSNEVPEDTLHTSILYLKRHGEAGHLCYVECQELGFSKGSGAIESAIRRVINQRLKNNGTFWHEDSAEAMLTLRAHLLSDNWDESFKKVRENRRTVIGSQWQWKAQNMLGENEAPNKKQPKKPVTNLK